MPRPKHPKTNEVVSLYLAGMSPMGISRRLGIHNKNIYAMLERAGVWLATPDDPEPLVGVEHFYGDVRVVWRSEEWARLQAIKEARPYEA